MKHNILIIGGGIAGLSAAIAVQKAGYSAVVYEAAESLRPLGAGLGLSANAMRAFAKLGIRDEVIARGRLLDGFSILDEKGRVISHTDSRALSKKFGPDNFTIHRAALHEVLLAAVAPNMIRTGKKCLAINSGANNRRIRFADGDSVEADYVIVADGIHSPLRQQLVPDSAPRYAGYTCWRGLVSNRQLNIQQSMEIWGSKGRFGLVPLANDQLYWFATTNSPANNLRYKNYSAADLRVHFTGYPAAVSAALDAWPESHVIWNDIADIKPLDRFAYDNVLLIGDAAHASTPNMGQGACQAAEDAAVLYEELCIHADIENAFRHFEKRRLDRTRFIIRQSARIGKMGQITNPFIAGLRNRLMRALPAAIKEKQLARIYQTDF